MKTKSVLLGFISLLFVFFANVSYAEDVTKILQCTEDQVASPVKNPKVLFQYSRKDYLEYYMVDEPNSAKRQHWGNVSYPALSCAQIWGNIQKRAQETKPVLTNKIASCGKIPYLHYTNSKGGSEKVEIDAWIIKEHLNGVNPCEQKTALNTR